MLVSHRATTSATNLPISERLGTMVLKTSCCAHWLIIAWICLSVSKKLPKARSVRSRPVEKIPSGVAELGSDFIFNLDAQPMEIAVDNRIVEHIGLEALALIKHLRILG